MSEREFVRKIQAGDREALKALYEQYSEIVFNVCLRILSDQQEAEDITQEVFFKAYKNLKNFRSGSKLSTWLYTVVSNHCLMMARSNKKHAYISLDDEDALIDKKNITDWDTNPDKLAENKELGGILDEAIKKLAPEYRVVFMLRDIQGFSTEETGEAIGLSVPAVKSRLHRARAFLRNELNNTFGYEKRS